MNQTSTHQYVVLGKITTTPYSDIRPGMPQMRHLCLSNAEPGVWYTTCHVWKEWLPITILTDEHRIIHALKFLNYQEKMFSPAELRKLT